VTQPVDTWLAVWLDKEFDALCVFPKRTIRVRPASSTLRSRRDGVNASVTLLIGQFSNGMSIRMIARIESKVFRFAVVAREWRSLGTPPTESDIIELTLRS
jgi:hypothetical protein